MITKVITHLNDNWYVNLEQKQTNFYNGTSKVLFKGIGKGIMKSGK